MEATTRFGWLVAMPDASVPLDEVSLLIAAHAVPGLDVAAYLGRLDDLAERCPAPTLDALVAHLFHRGPFQGNRDDYYDPRNSLLSEVIDRGLGIPITLSVLAMEIGRRLGVPLSGVGMPGHFLLRDKVDPGVFVDAFHGGRLLDASGCRALHRGVVGPGARWDPSWLDPVPRLAIVGRMLNNLNTIYERANDRGSLAWVRQLYGLLPGASASSPAEQARAAAPYN